MIGLGDIDAGLNLLSRLRGLSKWYQNWKNPPPESVQSRFIRLFESHGVHRNQIPRYFGHGISLRDIQDENFLLSKLNETTLDSACECFEVHREWLEGASPQPHPCHDFYKNPRNFVTFIQDLKRKNPNGQLSGVLIAPIENDRQAEALLILQELIDTIGDKPIYRYHLCNDWPFTYWKARAYLTACIATAWKHKIYILGTFAPMKSIALLAHGQTLLGWQGEGIPSYGGKRWYPEDMALRPDVFLKGLDPEEDNFGIKSGLRLWLDLEQEGYMNTGLDQACRPLFQQELAKYEDEL